MQEFYNDFDINKYKYQTYCVLGSSGSGKTSFLMHLKDRYSKCVILRNDLLLTKDKVMQKINKALLTRPALILIDDLLLYLNKEEKKTVIDKIVKSGANLVCVVSDIEETSFFEYTIVLKNNKIVLEGETLSVLNEEKIMKKLGLNLPFTIDLSHQLNYYDLIDDIYIDNDELVRALWK